MVILFQTYHFLQIIRQNQAADTSVRATVQRDKAPDTFYTIQMLHLIAVYHKDTVVRSTEQLTVIV